MTGHPYNNTLKVDEMKTRTLCHLRGAGAAASTVSPAAVLAALTAASAGVVTVLPCTI